MHTEIWSRLPTDFLTFCNDLNGYNDNADGIIVTFHGEIILCKDFNRAISFVISMNQKMAIIFNLQIRRLTLGDIL